MITHNGRLQRHAGFIMNSGLDLTPELLITSRGAIFCARPILELFMLHTSQCDLDQDWAYRDTVSALKGCDKCIALECLVYLAVVHDSRLVSTVAPYLQ